MRTRSLALSAVLACTAVGAAVAVMVPATAATRGAVSAKALSVGRQALPANLGWAAAGTGTTGGSAADDAHVFVARTRSELVAALGGDNATNGTNTVPRLVFVDGRIDGNVDDSDRPLSCADYAAPGWDFAQFRTAYDPATWGTTDPEGPLEDARVASTANQARQIQINVGSNVTIVGLRKASLNGVSLQLNKASNVIIRNLTIRDAFDCFPSWEPRDTAPGQPYPGNWNSLYDAIALKGSTNVWIDHNRLNDGDNPDAGQPTFFNRPLQVHDGLVDITAGSDLVTVSNNHIHDHDKVSLVGSSNSSTIDPGKLRVTFTGNRFVNLGQRLPRVRFGQVDVYNNYYQWPNATAFVYAWGVGVNSAIYAENNFFSLPPDIPLGDLVYNWSGKAITEKGTLVAIGDGPATPVSLVGEFNAAHDPDLGTDAGWTPVLRGSAGVLQTRNVPGAVMRNAGVGRLGI